MFYVSKTGVNVIQFGMGDIEVGGNKLSGLKKGDKIIGCVSLHPLNPPIKPNTNIDRSKEHAQGLTDEDLGVHTRLVFTDIRSIDALIHELYNARSCMEEGFSHPSNQKKHSTQGVINKAKALIKRNN